jgi:RNA polymerase sigma-32 factor
VRLTKNASLNAPLSTDGEGGSWIDWLEDDGMQVKDIIEDNSKMNHARNAFASAVSQTLNDREKDILIRRRLKEDQDTLETLSSEYEVSKERVRQIEVAALEKIAQHISNETGLDIDMANLSHIKTGKQAKVIHPKTLTNA